MTAISKTIDVNQPMQGVRYEKAHGHSNKNASRYETATPMQKGNLAA